MMMTMLNTWDEFLNIPPREFFFGLRRIIFVTFLIKKIMFKIHEKCLRMRKANDKHVYKNEEEKKN